MCTPTAPVLAPPRADAVDNDAAVPTASPAGFWDRAAVIHLHTLIHHPSSGPDADTPHSRRNRSTVDADGTVAARSTESGESGPLPADADLSADRKSGQVPPPAAVATRLEPSAEVGHGVRSAGPADAASGRQDSLPDTEAPTPRPDLYLPTEDLRTADPTSARRGRRPAADEAVLLGIARTIAASTGRLGRAAVRDAICARGLVVGNTASACSCGSSVPKARRA